MEWKIVNGSYLPAYLLIDLKETTTDIKSIREIDPRDQRTFFHEYTHFLQNITTSFGHAHTWFMYDRTRQVIADLRKNNSKQLKLPLVNPTIDHQKTVQEVMNSLEGSYPSKGVDDATAKVTKVNMYDSPSFRKMYPHSSIHFLNLHLKDDLGRMTDYHFGESAVSETMANLMEERLYGPHQIRNFPYRAGLRLAEYVYPEFAENDEWIFALCDLAMCCPYPGMAFYTMLLDFSRSDFLPIHSEDIYSYGERQMVERGWNIWSEFKKNKDGATYVLTKLLDHPFFKETLQWFIHLLETGYQYRENTPAFMLGLYRSPDAFSGLWKDIYEMFGTPMSRTQDHKRYFWAPSKLQAIEDKIDPIFLISMKQVNDTLFDGKHRCGLFEICDKAQKGAVTDFRCISEPWLRSKDDPTCAFGAQWQLYGLADKKIMY